MEDKIEKLENEIRNLRKWTTKQDVEWNAYRALKKHPQAKRSDLDGFIERYEHEQEELTEMTLKDIRDMHKHLMEFPDLWLDAMVETLTYTKRNCTKEFETYGQLTEFFHGGFSYCLERMNKVLDGQD